MAEGQIYLHPQGITLTGSFAQVFFNLKRLAAYYPTLGALQHQLTPAASKTIPYRFYPSTSKRKTSKGTHKAKI